MGEEAVAGTGASAQGAVDSGRDTFPTVLSFQGSEEGGTAAEKGATGAEEGADKGKQPPAFSLKDAPEFKEFSEKLTKAEERAIRAEAQVQALMSGRGERQPDRGEPEPDFEDLSALSADELREQWDKDPHHVYGNLLRQARHEVRQDLMGEFTQRSTRDRQNSSLQAFVKENGDFLDLYQSGALNDIIQGNPIHSPVSAYLFHKLQGTVSKADHEKALKEAEEKGRKEALRNADIRQGARVLGPGPARHPAAYQGGNKIKTEDYGGDSTNALLARHRARKEAQR